MGGARTMFSKRSVIGLLVGLNLILIAALVLGSYSLPTALGQGVSARTGDFVSVTAKVSGQSYDVLYVLDVREHKLHAFFPPSVQNRQLVYGQFRNLKADFGRRD